MLADETKTWNVIIGLRDIKRIQASRQDSIDRERCSLQEPLGRQTERIRQAGESAISESNPENVLKPVKAAVQIIARCRLK